MITIDQLLESVDLDFEPRWVTKDQNGYIILWGTKPRIIADGCWGNVGWRKGVSRLKLAEFDGKDWTECIYEVPRKTTGKIEKLERHIRVENGYEISCPPEESEIIEKINLLIDAVNELKSRAENVQPPCVRLHACSDGAVFDNEDMAKSHEANLKSKQSMN